MRFAEPEKECESTPGGRLEMSQAPPFPPVIALLGPTAVGKSRFALELCQEFGGAILSADSRQVYRYMDICTAKPTLAERAAVPHYMVDLVEPSDSYTAQRFADEGLRVLRAAALRRQPVFVVGGTGFYVSVLLGRRSMPPVIPDQSLRAVLRDEAGEHGSAALHLRLQSVDPASAERIHPNNLPRLIRALEIVAKTGQPVEPESLLAPVPALHLGLHMERTALHRRTDARITEQLQQNLIGEAATLLDMGYAPELPALNGLGYRQMIQYLRGDCSYDEAIAHYKTATHQYVRRQLTWFRKDPRVEWVDVNASTASALRQLVGAYLTTVS